MTPPDPVAIARAAGSAPATTRRVPGGDVCEALRIDLRDARSVFVKYRRDAPAGMFRAEAAGLQWLREAGGLRIPEIVALGDDWLAMEWIERGPSHPDTDEALGRGLAHLHRAGAPAFGADHPGFIGPIAVPNDWCDDWPTFLAECRLIPLARTAGLGTDQLHRLDALITRLPDRVGPPEPPARLHGDLWTGNRMTDTNGAPVLVDPAAYGGHREVDLAMMHMFGGFSQRVFDAYEEEYPLAPGHDRRRDLNRLIPLLVHATLFRGRYLTQVDQVLRDLV
ncbi:MAG: fructosamine kinase [Thermoleophilia bacterium]|nr:fructosamine kinase [Thermoleophilia bacterium]